MPHLSKSDFKIASTCAKKLVYKKKYYKTRNDGNEFMEMLAEGGFVVGKLAQLLYPGGKEVSAREGIKFSVKETADLLSTHKNIVLFEAAFLVDDMFVRVDILEKKGNKLSLIEVKARSYDSSDKKCIESSSFREYIEDVVYQFVVMEKALKGKGYSINASLLMPDKAKMNSIEGLAGYFSVEENGGDSGEAEVFPARESAGFSLPVVSFKYDGAPDRDDIVNDLKQKTILTRVNVDAFVAKYKKEILQRARKFTGILVNGVADSDYAPSKGCRSCEFNLGKITEGNGYRECWEELTDTDPHVFDLYLGGAIRSGKGFYIDDLIRNRTVSLYDFDKEKIIGNKKDPGARAQRQLLQMEYTRRNEEVFLPGMKDALSSLVYPLHFIDFETYSGAIPHHKDMHPYETVAFQWSCHTIVKPGAAPKHTEWINDGNDLPNYKFAESLMEQIGHNGTPLMWATHENTVLRAILQQSGRHGYAKKKTLKWLDDITSDGKEKTGRLIDMNDLALRFYFHPYMKGKTSIKKVLPAVWNHNPLLHTVKYFSKYYGVNEDGTVKNPYDTLPPISVFGSDEEEVIKDGTGAMRAYHQMFFSKDKREREKLRSLLLQYCQLDTMAMVIIWKYWNDRIK